MKILVLGATGLAGQSFCRQLKELKFKVFEASRSNNTLNYSSEWELTNLIYKISPNIIFNCIGLININKCEEEPNQSWNANVIPPKVLSNWSKETRNSFIHISTDHFYDYGYNSTHSITDPIHLLNQYSKHKMLAEEHALASPYSLVLRTSITGSKINSYNPTFWQWALDVVRNDSNVNLYQDAFTSTIDVDSFTKHALKLFFEGVRGLLNLASSQVYSKSDFVFELSKQMNKPIYNYDLVKIRNKDKLRANCLGLDVSKTEQLLNEKLPNLQKVISNLLEQELYSAQI